MTGVLTVKLGFSHGQLTERNLTERAQATEHTVRQVLGCNVRHISLASWAAPAASVVVHVYHSFDVEVVRSFWVGFRDHAEVTKCSETGSSSVTREVPDQRHQGHVSG